MGSPVRGALRTNVNDPVSSLRKNRMLSQLLSWCDGLAPRRRSIYILTCVVVTFFIASFVLEHGTWTCVEEFHGPYERNPADVAQYVVPIGTDIPFLSIPSPRAERDRVPGESSSVRLWINGQNYKTLEPSIEQGKLWGIRGLSRTLRFSLPAGVANDATTSLKVEYQIRVHRTIYQLIIYCACVLFTLAITIAYRVGDIPWANYVAVTIRRELHKHKIARELIIEAKLQLTRPVRSVLLGTPVLALLVFAVLAARWLFLPPVYWDSDLAVLLMWPLSIVPHWQWLSPVLSALITEFGFKPGTIAAICLVQLALYGLCLLALLRAFRSFWPRIIVMLGVFFQFYMLLIEGSISTEPFGSSGLLLGLAASVLYAERMIFEGELDLRCVVSSVLAFALCMMLAANSRLPLLPLAYVFPVTVALCWMGSWFTSRHAPYHVTALACCGIITILIIGQAWATNQLVCIFNGSASCVSPYGRAGAELIAFDLRSVDVKTRSVAVAGLQEATADPLVKEVFSVAANDTVSTAWILQQKAIAADPKVTGDPTLAERVLIPGELDRVMARATWLFQTKGGKIFWHSTAKRIGEYLDVDAMWRLATGHAEILFNPASRFARDWLATSASAVLTFENTYPDLLPIFDNPSFREKEYIELRDNGYVQIIDTFSGPIASEIMFLIVFALTVAVSLMAPRIRPALAICGAAVITVGGYSVIMAASEGIIDRYRMPSIFLLSVLTFCLIGILLDFAKFRRLKPAVTPSNTGV